MPSRHRSRERALQMVFQWEASGDAPDRVVETYWATLADGLSDERAEEDPFANELFWGVTRNVEPLDGLIRKHADNWKLERMAAVDRNILRLAIHEIQSGKTPAPVVINEALDIGRRFSGEQSARFLNGVLDAVRKTLERDGSSPDSLP